MGDKLLHTKEDMVCVCVCMTFEVQIVWGIFLHSQDGVVCVCVCVCAFLCVPFAWGSDCERWIIAIQQGIVFVPVCLWFEVQIGGGKFCTFIPKKVHCVCLLVSLALPRLWKANCCTLRRYCMCFCLSVCLVECSDARARCEQRVTCLEMGVC